MKILSRTAIVIGLLIGSCVGATAQEIQWTLDDIDFSNGNTATGSFVTDYAAPSWAPNGPEVWSIVSFSIMVSGPDTASAFTATNMSSAYLPGEIGFANANWSEYVDLSLISPLTTSGGTISIISGYDCPGCGTLLTNGDGPEVVGALVPEASPRLLLVVGLIALAIGMRLKPHSARQ